MKKGYKVCDVNRHKKIGVAAENLQELINKSCKKLGVNARCAECKLCVAEDGTLVDDDDYLATLPPQTLLVLVKTDETMVTDFEFYYNMIRSTKREYIETGYAAKNFMSTNIKEKLSVFKKYIEAADDANTMLSDRAQDPAWFEGLEPSEKTKEQSMSKRAKDRMRGFFYKTKSALQASELYIKSKNGQGKNLIDQFILDLRKLLETNKYNETYFNRKADESSCICSKAGLFECGGLWSISKCAYEGEHLINPYRSREERIIFQTWNLDHRIELSRSIIPMILAAVGDVLSGSITCTSCEKQATVGRIESDRYYLQIFTRYNLKLVHIVCHYKGKHAASSNVYILCRKCTGNKTIKYD